MNKDKSMSKKEKMTNMKNEKFSFSDIARRRK
jgi:hypothetical protein